MSCLTHNKAYTLDEDMMTRIVGTLTPFQRISCGMPSSEDLDWIRGLEAQIASLDKSLVFACELADKMIAERNTLESDKAKLETRLSVTEGAFRELELINAGINDTAFRLTVERDRYRTALVKLACLGNGDVPGNSVGNCIALAALESTKRP